MKKLFAIVLTLAMVLSLAACGGKEEAPAAPAAPAAPSAPAAPAAPSAPAKDPIMLKLCCSETATSVLGQQLQIVMNEFNEYAAGSVVIEFFPDNQLGSLDDLEEQVASGAPILLSTGAGNLSKFAPKLGILGVPYILSGLYDYMYAPQTDWWASNVAPDLEAQNIKLLSFQSNGYRHFIGSQPAATVQNVKDYVWRMGPNPQLQGYVTIMGGSPANNAWSDNYTLIQAGTIDGCEASIDLLWTSSLAEVCDYLTLTGHFTTPSSVMCNLDIWGLLTTDQQDKLLELFNQLAINVSDEMVASEAEYVQNFVDAGTTVIYPEDIAIDEFKAFMPKLCEELGYDAAEVEMAVEQIAAAAAADGR